MKSSKRNKKLKLRIQNLLIDQSATARLEDLSNGEGNKMAPLDQFLKLMIALLLGTALLPTLSAAQSPQVSPLPSAPPEIMSKELPDPKACAQQGLTMGQDNKPQSADPMGNSLSEQLARSEGVICPPPGIDPGIRVPTPEGGRMPVISPPGSPGGNPDIRPK